ncbi:uncharacterized protein LOC132314737 [Cornus florida]|uniref:uncharacterized protein LOC132314737 n=1 Tax=Cornus florida TaxID=4283 RepID=UPI002897E411|nr:uncharacterized protein LOC132314737 [Cornus florida]
MAYPSSSMFFFLFGVVLIASTTPMAHGSITLTNLVMAQINVLGRVACSINGNGNSSTPGVAGAVLTLSCNGSQTNLGQAVTNTTGFFNVVLNAVDGLLFDPSACSVNVNLPLLNCYVSPPTGTLRSAVNLLNILPSTVGQVATLVSGLFEAVPT